jgi:hypothetical protein
MNNRANPQARKMQIHYRDSEIAYKIAKKRFCDLCNVRKNLRWISVSQVQINPISLRNLGVLCVSAVKNPGLQ